MLEAVLCNNLIHRIGGGEKIVVGSYSHVLISHFSDGTQTHTFLYTCLVALQIPTKSEFRYLCNRRIMTGQLVKTFTHCSYFKLLPWCQTLSVQSTNHSANSYFCLKAKTLSRILLAFLRMVLTFLPA